MKKTKGGKSTEGNLHEIANLNKTKNGIDNNIIQIMKFHNEAYIRMLKCVLIKWCFSITHQKQKNGTNH